MLTNILQQFGFIENALSVEPFGSGLINHTWLVKNGGGNYILQRINTQVFKDPHAIDDNIRAMASYLKEHHPDYYFTVPVSTTLHKTLVDADGQGCFRLFEYVNGSHSYNTATTEDIAYEAAKQFGKFTRLLSGFDSAKLKTTLPDFHNLVLRQKQFESAVSQASGERLQQSAGIIKALQEFRYITAIFESIQQNPDFKKRVTHHDTKISNVLFDARNKGICVIDLDTVMPGYFISDVGDMMRTYLSPAGEEETDLSKVYVRESFFDAITRGYLEEMQDELSATEKAYFIYSGKFLIYMQALRFITDYLNHDVYYGAKYPLHNYNRAANQLRLLQELVAKEQELNAIVASY